ncbi:MAG: division plane positioning ATPase MipZ [Janthinobacterium lividum]
MQSGNCKLLTEWEICVRVIVLASQKGGSGKTTLAGHLATEALRRGDPGSVVMMTLIHKPV